MLAAMTSRFPCPCCGHRTLPQRDYYHLCPVCFWEDDPEQSVRPWGWDGANGISLVEAQQAYLRSGAMGAEFLSKVRPPAPEEARESDWQPYDPSDGEIGPLWPDHIDDEDQGSFEDEVSAFNTGLAELRRLAADLTLAQLEARLRELCAASTGVPFGEAEIELLARLTKDEHWPVRHPVGALAWAWRHRRHASMRRRLRQLRTRSFIFAG